MFRLTLRILIIMLLTIWIYACQKPQAWQITFETGQGSALNPILVVDGIVPNLPIPEHVGHNFAGWYLDATFEESYEGDPITMSMILYAKWQLKTFKITLHSSISALESIWFDYDAEIALPILEDSNHHFLGWFEDPELNIIFDYDKMPAKNIDAYAAWEVLPTNGRKTESFSPYTSLLFGNTNGNTNNLGLAVYDHLRERHLYSAGNRVYAYSPSNNEITLLFSLEENGRPLYLNIHNDNVYVINNENGHMMRYQFDESAISTYSNNEHFFMVRSQTTILNKYYSTMSGNPIFLGRYVAGTSSHSGSPLNTDNIQIGGTSFLYTEVGGLKIYHRDAWTLGGHLTVGDLGHYEVQTLDEMVLNRLSNFQIECGLILTKDDEQAFYVYRSDPNYDGERFVKVMSSIGGSMHSLNWDGTAFYLITGSDNAAIWRIPLATLNAEKLIDVPAQAMNLNIINHWIYFGIVDDNRLYRVHPISRSLTLLS